MKKGIVDLANVAERQKQGSPWYEIRNASEKEAELWIYNEVSRFFGTNAEDFNRDLAKIKASVINLRVNSPGGNVFDGLAIFNALRRHPAKVISHVDGLAASIASIITLAGDEVRMASNAFMMIHNAHAIAIGDAKALREIAELLDKTSGSLIGIYAARTGKDATEIQKLMDAETWMSAQEAVDEGFADSVIDPVDAEASFDLSAFQHVPPALAARATGVTPKEEPAADVGSFVLLEEQLWSERMRLREMAASIQKPVRKA